MHISGHIYIQVQRFLICRFVVVCSPAHLYGVCIYIHIVTPINTYL